MSEQISTTRNIIKYSTLITGLFLFGFVVAVKPASADRMWSSGFELQSASNGAEWFNYNNVFEPAAISTSIKRSGNASLVVTGLRSGISQAVNQGRVSLTGESVIPDGVGVYARAYLYITTAPSGNNTIMGFGSADNNVNVGRLLLQSDRKLALVSNTGGDFVTIGTSTTVLSTGQWYMIELYQKRHATTPKAGADELTLRIDGITEVSSTAASVYGGVRSFYLGGNMAYETQTQGEWYFDDVAVNDDRGTSQTSWPGEGKIVHLNVDDAGEFSQTVTRSFAPAYIQHNVKTVTNSGVITLNNVATGNLIAVGIAQSASAVREYTVTDSAGNTYVSAVKINPDSLVEIFYAKNVTGGNLTITITSNYSVTFTATVVEVAGADPANPLDVTSSLYDTVNATSHYCAGAGGIDTSANVFVFCTVTTNANPSLLLPGSSYSSIQSTFDYVFSQYKSSTAALVDDLVPWGSTSSRLGYSVVAVFKAPVDFAGEANDYQAVDEVISDDAGSMLAFTDNSADWSSAGSRAMFNVSNMPVTPASVTLVHQGTRISNLSTAGSNFELGMQTSNGGTKLTALYGNFTSVGWSTNYSSNSFRPYRLTAYTDPSGVAWTENTINSLQIGIRASDAYPDFYVTKLWALVEYIEAGSGNITISGSVYSDEGSTLMSGTQTVRVKVNGAGDYSAILDSGSYSVSNVSISNPGSVITAFLDGATEKAVTVTRAADTSSAITGLNLYQDYVILRHEDSGPITNANLDQYDSGGDADIQFTVTDGALTSSSGRLLVWDGKTYTPGGAVTAAKLRVNASATLNAGANAVTVTGSGTSTIRPFINLGTLTHSGNFTYSGDAATDVETGTYNNLAINISPLSASIAYATNGAVSAAAFTATTALGDYELGISLGGTLTLTGALTLQCDDVVATQNFATNNYAVSAASVSIGSCAAASLGSSTVTLSGSGDALANQGTFTAGTSTVNYTSTSATNVAGLTYYNLGVGTASDGLAGAVFSLAGNVTANSITVGNASSNSADTLSQGAYNITTSGSGTVVTVTSKGIWQNISTGDITLSGDVTNDGQVIFKSSNSDQCTDVADDIVITSSNPVVVRTWSGSGTFTVNNVSATAMSDGAITITAYSSTLTNTDWTEGICGASITISGSVYSDEGSTKIVGTQTVRIKVNGAGDYSAALSSGDYSIDSVIVGSAGDVITAYLDGATEKAVTVTRAADTSSAITGLNLYQDYVILRHEDSGPITNANLDQYDSGGDADIGFTVTTGALAVSGSNALYTWPGKSFTPGGTVNTPKLVNAGTYNAESYGLTISGSGTGSSRPFINQGTFNAGTASVVYSGTSATQLENIDSYYGLTLFPYLSSATAYSTNGGLTAESLTFVAMSGSSNTLTLTLDGSLNAGTLSMQAISSGLGVLDTASNPVTAGTLSIGAGTTLIANSSLVTVTGSGASFSNSGTFNAGASTVKFTGTSATTIQAMSYHNIEFVPSSGSPTYTISAGTLAVNDLTLGNGTNAVTLTSATNNPTVNITGNMTLAANSTFTKGSATTVFKKGGTQTLTDNTAAKQDLGNVQISVNSTNTTLNLGSSAKVTKMTVDSNQTLGLNGSNILTLTGSGTSASRPFVINGSFEASTGTIAYTGTSATSITATTYHNLSLIPASGSPTYTFGISVGQYFYILGDYLVGDGTNAVDVDLDTNTARLYLDGDLTISANAGTYTAATGSVFTLRPNGTVTITDQTNQSIGSVWMMSGSNTPKAVLGSNIKSKLFMVEVSHELDLNSYTLTLTNNSSPLAVAGTFTPSTGTVEFASAGTTGTIVPALSYYNLKLNKTGNTFTAAAGTLNVSNNLEITAGTLDLNANDPTVSAKNVIITDTLVASATAVFTITGNWTNNGTFTHSSGTVTFAPASGYSAVAGSSINIFHNFSSEAPGKELRFAAGQRTTFEGELQVSGSIENVITIDSDSPPTAWQINLTGTYDMGYVMIKNSACYAGTAEIQGDATFVNGGNNGACWILAVVGGELPGFTPVDGGTSGGGTGAEGGESGSGLVIATAYTNPSTAANDNSHGGYAWINPSDALTSNDAYSSVTGVVAGTNTNYLKLTNFGFSLPTNATIVGVEIKVEHHGTVAREMVVSMVVGGVVSGANPYSEFGGAQLPETDGLSVHGGSTYTFVLTITPAQANGSDFGVVLAYSKIILPPPSTAEIYVDSVQMKLYYTLTETSGGGEPTTGGDEGDGGTGATP